MLEFTEKSQVTEERFKELWKMLNFLIVRKSIEVKCNRTSPWVDSYSVICSKTQKLIALIATNTAAKTYWFEEGLCS